MTEDTFCSTYFRNIYSGLCCAKSAATNQHSRYRPYTFIPPLLITSLLKSRQLLRDGSSNECYLSACSQVIVGFQQSFIMAVTQPRRGNSIAD